MFFAGNRRKTADVKTPHSVSVNGAFLGVERCKNYSAGNSGSPKKR